jgi:hypothetical protein
MKIISKPYLSLLSTPANKRKFNVYHDIKWKLVKKGVPENEIAFIHDCDTDIKKKEFFAKVRSGQVRIIFGSTQKMEATPIYKTSSLLCTISTARRGQAIWNSAPAGF